VVYLNRSRATVGLGSKYVAWFDLRQLTDVSHCNLQQHLSRNRHRARLATCPDLPRSSRAERASAQMLQPAS